MAFTDQPLRPEERARIRKHLLLWSALLLLWLALSAAIAKVLG